LDLDAIRVVDRLGQRMRQVDGVDISPWKEATLGVDVGRFIVINGEFVA